MRLHSSYIVVVLVGAAAGVGCGGNAGDLESAATASSQTRSTQDRSVGGRTVVPSEVEPRLPAGTRTHVDRRDRVRIALPPGWHRASESATRRLSLVEGNILAVGTDPIRPRAAAACSGAPDEPRVEIGPAGALVLVEEDRRARAALARKRPRFRLLEQVAPPTGNGRARTSVFPSWPCRSPVGVSGLRETAFADGGRVFSVTLMVGAAASESTRSAALAVVDSLRPVAR